MAAVASQPLAMRAMTVVAAKPLARRAMSVAAARPLTVGGYNFHPRFVRENLGDEKTWDSSSHQRLVFNVPPSVQGVVEGSSGDSRSFKVSFNDGGSGPFELPPAASCGAPAVLEGMPRTWWKAGQAETLRSRALDASTFRPLLEDHQQDLAVSETGVAQLWSMEEKAEARAWLETLHQDGVALVTGMPTAPGEMVKFGERLFGYVLPTVYGQTFTIKARENANNLAYSSLGLQLHTDLPFCAGAPPIQLFHSIEQARVGGGSIFADGFRAAERLRESHPELFRVLTDHSVGFQDKTPSWDLYAEHPTIEVGRDGEIRRVHFNERARASWRQWSETDCLQDTDLFYRALAEFEKLLEDTEQHINLVLAPGEMIVIDNCRLLHSREGFEGARWMEGGYITWEQVQSLWRICQEQA